MGERLWKGPEGTMAKRDKSAFIIGIAHQWFLAIDFFSCDGYITSSIYFHQCSAIVSDRYGAIDFFSCDTYIATSSTITYRCYSANDSFSCYVYEIINGDELSTELSKTQLPTLPASLYPEPTSPTGLPESLPEPLRRHQCRFCEKTFSKSCHARRHEPLTVSWGASCIVSGAAAIYRREHCRRLCVTQDNKNTDVFQVAPPVGRMLPRVLGVACFTRSFTSSAWSARSISCKRCLYPGSAAPAKHRDSFPLLGAAVAERLTPSPPTTANRAQSPAGSPDFRMWESCLTMLLVGGFSWDLPFPLPLHSGAAPCTPQASSSALKTSLLRAWEVTHD
ncbi:hypothetical protein PR048_021842 [Dryococelus australis]|uniref:C2H2-type domain-containing protein n=1 Tax=Dryococelus australis TaxID=614101 RepID=A0ABQ9GZJ0_9NEOP|nr:hypothetical protein PR048_021842 [Dryococelus australis]